jgi:hypothetical protein
MQVVHERQIGQGEQFECNITHMDEGSIPG